MIRVIGVFGVTAILLACGGQSGDGQTPVPAISAQASAATSPVFPEALSKLCSSLTGGQISAATGWAGMTNGQPKAINGKQTCLYGNTVDRYKIVSVQIGTATGYDQVLSSLSQQHMYTKVTSVTGAEKSFLFGVDSTTLLGIALVHGVHLVFISAQEPLPAGALQRLGQDAVRALG